MTKITFDLDDEVANRLAALSRAQNLSIEQWFRSEAEKAAHSEDQIEIANASHRAILSTLDRPEGYYESPRDEIYDRERGRAELYASAREDLLALVDGTEGDMGSQTWDRERVYGR